MSRYSSKKVISHEEGNASDDDDEAFITMPDNFKANTQAACENTQPARPTRERENTRGRKHRKTSQYSKHLIFLTF